MGVERDNGPAVSIGPVAKAAEPAFQSSCAAISTMTGRSWPPHRSGALTPFQPAAANRRKASFQPGAVKTCPGQPNAFAVADPVERGEFRLGETTGLGQDRLQRVDAISPRTVSSRPAISAA